MPIAQTFQEHKDQTASEKILLARLEASRKLKGWSVHSGSVYSVSFSEPKVTSISQDGVDLTEVSDLASVSAGNWFFDRQNSKIYLETSDSADPDLKFIGCVFELFFSTHPVRDAHDLSTGYAVQWLPLIRGASEFGVGLDNREANLGAALEGSGSIVMANDFNYWSERYDKYSFENRRCRVYMYSRTLPIDEAKLIYNGVINTKDFSLDEVVFELRDLMNALRSPVTTTDLKDVGGARVTESLERVKARRVYGYVFGHVCAPIDQMRQDFPLTGTVTVAVTSTAITGAGTSFLKELCPGDEITVGDDAVPHVIDAVTSDTAATFTDAYSGTNSGSSSFALFKSSRGKRYANRTFKIAGHVLARPTTTVASVSSDRVFTLTDASQFLVGDSVEINGEQRFIANKSTNRITLNQILTTQPSVSDDIFRSTVQNVYINDRILVLTRDYTYDAAAATITLEEDAELNAAPILVLETGTIQITSGSRTVLGSGTSFKADLKIGDWIRGVGKTDYFEILSIETDLSLTVRTVPAPVDAVSGAVANIKKPEVFKDKGFFLVCDAVGITDDGTTSGTILKFANQIVKDLMTDSGLSNELDSSFDETVIEGEHRLGFASPMKWADKTQETLQSLVRRVNRSVMGSIYQTNDFTIGFKILRPSFTDAELTKIDNHDIIDLDVKSDSKSIVKTIRIRYRPFEYEPISGETSFSEESAESDRANFLATTSKELVIETGLVDQISAIIFSTRWRFFLEFPINLVSATTKLQTSELSINDPVRIEHPRLYKRFGSTDKVRIGWISDIKKGQGGVTLTVNDLGNAFARVARIAETGTNDFSEASDKERQNFGFITAADGMIENDEATDGINVIW